MSDTQKWLEGCDRRRYQDPRGVLAELEERIDDVPQPLMPLWCGVAGSCYRLLYELEKALDLLETGLAAADKHLDHSAAGNIHQRIFTVLWATPDYEKALDETRFAMTRYADVGNQTGIGKVLVDRGLVLGELQELKWSNSCSWRALEILPEEERPNRAAAYHQISRNILAGEGDGEEALRLSLVAESLAEDPENLAKGTWQTGRVMLHLGDPDGIKRIEAAAEALLELSPASGAMAVLDLAGQYLVLGDAASAHRAARSLRAILPCIGGKAAKLAAIELVNIGLAGKGLSRAVLGAARERMHRFY